jgi:copper(I)-binding protein
VDVPAGERIAFKPGGRHVMLYGLDPAIVPGTAVPLRFGFAGGSTAEAEAKTVAAGGDPPY